MMGWEEVSDMEDHYPIREAVASLPKAELHVHLEGAIRPTTFLRLAKQNNIEIALSDESGIADYFKFRDFEHFMQLFGESTYVLARPEDFLIITEELGLDAAANGIRYMEVTFTPGTHFRFKGLPFDEVMGAVAAGARMAKEQTGIEMRFILDHVRGFPIADCMQTAEWCVEGQNAGVVGMGLGGYEPGRPASMYTEVINWLKGQGVAFVPHAGEAEGPAGIWDALQFDPPRLGHGFRSIEDPELIAELCRRGVVLELCLTSNVCTGVVRDLRSHPLRKLWSAGLALTLNTDDPTMFNTTLNNEYLIAARVFGFDLSELAWMSLTAVNGSLVGKQTKDKLLNEFHDSFRKLGVTPLSPS
jgi:adenosine deaminase